ncbi:hypothetical protein GUJ93_ZPchr0002g25713 [Zizania palustris]|uniref:Uncharacterized protein n=1 Tax=Zizania palustris TaxID=103762 RepID=A0A8J5S3L8_ZIZPA|nr:hypothetical protein GUJ93_ZPchr0002g25713 [Zizania palustris]
MVSAPRGRARRARSARTPRGRAPPGTPGVGDELRKNASMERVVLEDYALELLQESLHVGRAEHLSSDKGLLARRRRAEAAGTAARIRRSTRSGAARSRGEGESDRRRAVRRDGWRSPSGRRAR